MNAVMPPTRFPTWKDQHYLLIDDTQGMRQLLRESLRSQGARYVDQASSGSEAIAMLAQTRYDVVLCDYHLGRGKNGQQVLEEAKFRELILPTTVWMMVSSEKTTEAVMGTAELHPDAYLLKPITEGVLLSRLHKVWNKKQVFRPIDMAYQQRDFLTAARLCDHQIEHNREHALNLLRMKANLLLKCGQQEQAKEVYERVLATKHFSWAVAGLAKIRLQNGETEAARQMLTEVINGNRYFMEAYDQLALAYQQMGQFEEAAYVLKTAANLSPNSVVRQRSLGELCLKLGRTSSAERAFRKCLAIGEHSVMKNPDAYLGLARVCGMKNDTEEALQLIERVQREFSTDHIQLRSKITEGLVHHEAGDYVQARKSGDELDSMLRMNPHRPPAAICLDMARLLLAVGVKDASVDLLRDLLRNNHDNPQLIAEIKQMFESAKMAQEGSNIITQSCDEAADMMNRGVLLWKTGRLQEAVNWMRTTVKALPNNQRVLFNCAQIIINCMEKYGYEVALAEEARAALLHVEKLNPGQPRFASMMATLNTMAQAQSSPQNA